MITIILYNDYNRLRNVDIAHVLEPFYQVEIFLDGNVDRRPDSSGNICRIDIVDSVLDVVMYSTPFRYHKLGNRIYLT